MSTIPKRVGRDLLLIGSVYFFYYLVIGPFQLVLQPRCEAAGLGEDAGALAIGFLYAALAMFRLAAGSVIARTGGRLGLVLATAGMGLAIAITFNVTTTVQLYAGMALIGAASALLWSAGGALSLAATRADRHGWAAGRLYVFTGVGLLLGALSIDWFLPPARPYGSAGFSRLQIAWLIAAGLALLSAWCVGLRGTRTQPIRHPLSILRELVQRGGTWVFLLLAGAALSYGAFYSIVTRLIDDVPQVREHLGTLSLPMYAIMAFSSLVVGPLSDRTSRRFVLIQGTLVGALGFLLLAAVTQVQAETVWPYWLLIGSGGFGLGWCFASVQTASMAWIGDAMAADDQATAIGLTFVGRDLGVAGASLAAVLLVRLGGQALALLAFGLVLLLLAPAGMAIRKLQHA